MDLTFDSRPPGIVYGYLPRVARLILRFGYKLRVLLASRMSFRLLRKATARLSDPITRVLIIGGDDWEPPPAEIWVVDMTGRYCC